MPPNNPDEGDRVLTGIGLGVLAYSLFSLHDASNKWLVASLPVWQILFFRSLTVVFGSIAVGRRKLLVRTIETPAKLPMLLRGAITLAAWLCYYSAARDLPLAQLLTLYFSAPIMTVFLAIPLLGERITRSRWLSLGLGFAGVLVASDPFGVRATSATLLVLVAAALWGYAIILMRQIARREPSLLQMFYQNLLYVAVTGALMLTDWTTPTAPQWGLLFAVGVLGGLGQFCLFEGARLAPASVMATVEYTALIWAFVLGYAIWHDIPTLPILAGAALILSSGLLLVLNERRPRQ